VLEEDADALRLQELGLKTRPQHEHDVLIGQDAGVAKARRLLQRKLAQEAAAAVPVAVPAPAASARGAAGSATVS
jgi:vanillate O-demethylase monooxygenase subunit